MIFTYYGGGIDESGIRLCEIINVGAKNERRARIWWLTTHRQ